jgi:hypothetical protein
VLNPKKENAEWKVGRIKRNRGEIKEKEQR